MKNLNASVCHPSKLPVIDAGWTPALKLLPSGSPQIRWRRMEMDKFSFLTSDAYVKKKKLNSPPSIPRHHICGDLEGTNSNAGVRCPSRRESFDGRRTPAFRFLTRSGSDHTSVSQTEFFTSVAIPRSHRPVFF